MTDIKDIQMRDPFVIKVPEEQRYYLYGTTYINSCTDPATRFDAYCSDDLKEWQGPFNVFQPSPCITKNNNPRGHRARLNQRHYLSASCYG